MISEITFGRPVGGHGIYLPVAIPFGVKNDLVGLAPRRLQVGCVVGSQPGSSSCPISLRLVYVIVTAQQSTENYHGPVR